MAIRMRLAAGETVTAEGTLEEIEARLARALREGGVVRVRDTRGRRLSVNPAQVLYLEEAGDWSASLPRPEPVRLAAAS